MPFSPNDVTIGKPHIPALSMAGASLQPSACCCDVTPLDPSSWYPKGRLIKLEWYIHYVRLPSTTYDVLNNVHCTDLK